MYAESSNKLMYLILLCFISEDSVILNNVTSSLHDKIGKLLV